ncbi:HNH endonuclease [Aquisphaera giovannonii]|uniref:HNH endonuclease n=1 Tax=Aquisphaera giovannonii TaxID=406548 RepID=A0A5B9W6N0_9BACT|nr:HNH endonuclease [Aquisphaera giovannonii]QEH35631.1 HNH endonuclease [Aquisphaera giovannonii]
MSKPYAAVAERAGHRCEYCRAPEVIFNLPFEVEHIVPSSRGGSDEESNLALACRACNLFKSDRQHAKDEVTEEVAPLFHPRLDVWNEHFQVDRDEGSIRGPTAIGRVAVAALQRNRDVQRIARISWMKLQLYP